MNPQEKIDRICWEVKSKVARFMVENKGALWSYFQQFEQDMIKKSKKKRPPGMIEPAGWQEGMHSVLGMDETIADGLPWQQIMDLLTIYDTTSGMVDYHRCLHRFRCMIRDEYHTQALPKKTNV